MGRILVAVCDFDASNSLENAANGLQSDIEAYIENMIKALSTALKQVAEAL
jgi:hypothetical protein